ncbi:hypothetical protein [Algiphilus aromaticivorans]|uniref:hypothetical protein n=1 Tax=Algiphilus aromaticivorans TaxID=382454 RepID=UPI0005C1C2C8|nr:hypothetical protein [Algiphilus aromaticivorans]
MHTLIMVACGLGALVLFLLLSGAFGIARSRAVASFLALWMVVALINLWVGVRQAGYTVWQELPFLVVVFGVPAAAAMFARRGKGKQG